MEDAPLLKGSRSRFAEAVKWLPVLFVSTIISGLYLIYMRLHVWPRLVRVDTRGTAFFEALAFNLITALLVICYVFCIQIAPGNIPATEEDPTWDYVPAPAAGEEGGLEANRTSQEWKRSGDRRQCKWCAKFKPDRCHHCRVCRTCILKMDHHCPWIYNCVGFNNHKYFFLFLLYTSMDCHLMAWTMLDTVGEELTPATPFLNMFLLLFGETLSAFLGIVLTLFFCFHIYLTVRAMTTVEFCEKSMKRAGYDGNVYDRGVYCNIKAVLGDHVLLWLLPLSPPPGSGLDFSSPAHDEAGTFAEKATAPDLLCGLLVGGGPPTQ